jgi:hypothetical protein
MKPQLNLLFSLPDDLIRGIYDMDTTYRETFSNAQFKTELEQGYWAQKQLQSEIRRKIYEHLRLCGRYSNRFFIKGFLDKDEDEDEDDNDEDEQFYFKGLSTPGMTPAEIASLPELNSRISDIESETYVYFSEHKGVLRFAIVPLSFKDNAPEYFKHAQSRCYDGVCTRDFMSVNFHESKYLRVASGLFAVNVGLILMSNGIMGTFHDAIIVSQLKEFSSNDLRLLAISSKRKFVLWI